MAINQQTLQGNWNELKGQLKKKWGQLTDNELDRVEGNTDQLIGLLQRKTGETKAAIESSLDEMMESSAAMLANAGDVVRNVANNATEKVQEASHYVAESAQAVSEEAIKQVQAGYTQTKRVVASRPVESLAVCFGVGLVTGIVAGLMMRSR